MRGRRSGRSSQSIVTTLGTAAIHPSSRPASVRIASDIALPYFGLDSVQRAQRGVDGPMENSILTELDRLGDRSKVKAQAEKKNYAEKLSDLLAIKFAQALRSDFAGIIPNEDGTGRESKARTAKGFKKLDVNYSTAQLGLGLGVSIKTCNFRDPTQKNYKKNITRIDNELRAEAHDYHERQPYSVMIAVLFLPADASDDATKRAPSSFGHAVQTFRRRGGRAQPSDSPFLFEGIFIGLYEPQGPERGSVCFFDVAKAPPWSGRPVDDSLLQFNDLVTQIRAIYDERNNPPFEWAE